MNLIDQKLVSIVVNCFNGELHLYEALNSIRNQNYLNYEVIFIDNCSIDNSAIIYHKFKEEDPRFKYYKTNENVKLGEARKFAVNRCKGKYISFLDVDDLWFSDKLSIQINLMENESSDISYSSYFEFKKNKEIKNNSAKLINPSFDVKNHFIKNLDVFQVSLPTLMIKNSILKDLNLNFDENIYVSEEFCLVMQLLASDVKVSISKSPMVAYRLSDNSLSVTGMKYWSLDRRYTLNRILEKSPQLKIKYSNEFKKAYFKADYYEALYLYVNGKNIEAIKLFRKAAFYNLRFFILFILFHPYLKFLFQYILKKKYKRKFTFNNK